MADNRLLTDAIDHHARTRGDQPALISGEDVTSYLALARRARRVAGALAASGVRSGARVALVAANDPRFFEIWHGAALAGVVLAPINARLTAAEVGWILADSGAEVLFVDPAHHALAEAIEAQAGVGRIVTLASHHPRWAGFDGWRDGHPEAALNHPAAAADTCVQMYTSGTTGHPKGVELSHAAVLSCIRVMMGRQAWGPGEVSLVAAPLFHTAGNAWAHCALQSGGTAVILPEPSPPSILAAIQRHRVTHGLLVPAMIRAVLADPNCRQTDFASLKRVLYGASPMPRAHLEQAVATFGCGLTQGYGLTETVGPVVFLRPEDHDGSARMTSCGKPVDSARVRVVDPDGADCAAGEVGEIIIATPQLMTGYWNNPEATAEAIRDGWLYTGDAGYFDSEGYLYIHDRMKDMIVSGGENVYPAEVESALSGCPGVADVAVIGVPDEHWGEAVKAVVVARPGEQPSEADVIAWARQRIAAFKCPKSVDFVDSIPRNPAGKMLKRELRKPYWEGQDRQVH